MRRMWDGCCLSTFVAKKQPLRRKDAKKHEKRTKHIRALRVIRGLTKPGFHKYNLLSFPILNNKSMMLAFSTNAILLRKT